MTLIARVHGQRTGNVAVGTVEGEVDASNAPEIGDQLRSLLTNRSMGLIVDLSHTTYLDSAGINLLFELGSELRQRQQELRVVVPVSTPVARMLAITGLGSAVPTYDTRAEALAHAK